MFRSERALRIICFEPVFLAFIPGGCPQSHTGQGFSSCVFSCQRAKKSIVLGHFPFQFELWLFLIWSWSIPVGASEIRCSTRIFAVSKTAATDHSRHESTKCEQDSKCGRSAQTDARVRISPSPPPKKPVIKPITGSFLFPKRAIPCSFTFSERKSSVLPNINRSPPASEVAALR